ncbi:hypothetical protein BC831DRAFT_480969 [Entophlyctis helioformis]|nr:hypothetical protein BC831DRAFT_480969 [Entophlyctis helioformis]
MQYPCKDKACAIQACIVRNGYDSSACQPLVAAFERCCVDALAAKTPGAETACASVWRWLDKAAAASALSPASPASPAGHH